MRLRGRLIVTFSQPEKSYRSVEQFDVREIVIGLMADNMLAHFIRSDDQGIVTGHAKYNGFLWVELLNLVNQIALPDNTLKPTQ